MNTIHSDSFHVEDYFYGEFLILFLERPNKTGKHTVYFISLYCFLSVQYLNYISVFQLIALN